LLDTEEGLQVYADYSVTLHLQDLEFTVGKVQDRSIKMQLLERADNKKWFVWSQQGMVTQKKQKQFISPFFDLHQAVAHFERKFEEHTENQWTMREFFEQKPGKYALKSAQKDQEKLSFCLQ
jgi:hypothetical protein